MRVSIVVGGIKLCIIAKVSQKVSESFYTIAFRVSSCEYTTFRVYECVSICAYMWSRVYVI